ncbi:hypothetical protein DACRYDRAFT_116975 [Dacryopinax primogenitus]|uniref:RING-CH-type domain-containing protein n=1 Tax=Dacryopinax primogenitus (strain DJM 731) TaxID=1858805 RepID=M5FZA4_DACPD|nr:uncharacterized protein DACRYDRAFT_116975 [Dacryopinax primogenitus]EJU01185.1 hypothetical protein DACRYDRAFT_116975 [Dacryopinax primogenitus]
MEFDDHEFHVPPPPRRPPSPTTSDRDDENAVENSVLLRRSHSPPPASPEDDRMCRICFGGVDDEPEMGRLIRPCLCKGSVSFVHVKCLNDWRRASRNRTSYLACAQCGYKYHFARTRVAGLATNPFILFLATLILFCIITLAAGSVMSYFLPPYLLSSTTDPQSTTKSPLLVKALLEEDDEDEDDFTTQLFFYTPAGAIQDVLESALRAFLSGDALRLMASFLGFSSNSKQIPIDNPVTGFKQTVRIGTETPLPIHVPPFLAGILQRLAIGTATIGILSFVNLLLSFSLLLPIQMGLRNVFRRGPRDSSATSTALIILFIIIGLGRAIHKVYKVTRILAGFILLMAETAILDVTQEDMERERKSIRACFQQVHLKFLVRRSWFYRLLKFEPAAWSDVRRAIRRGYEGFVEPQAG